MTPPVRSDFRFFHALVPRWGDMDALAHVNNVKFFTYDESARLEYFRQLMASDPAFWKDYGLILAPALRLTSWPSCDCLHSWRSGSGLRASAGAACPQKRPCSRAARSSR